MDEREEVSLFLFILCAISQIMIDGMAFWYAKSSTPPVLFSDSKTAWEGLAIIFDTYDNDGKGFEYLY